MCRPLVVAVFFAAVLLPGIDVVAGGSIFETILGRNHTSDQVNQRNNGKPIRVDTSSMNLNVKTHATINSGLRAIGLPSLLGPPKVQRQSVWVKGRGFVDITSQAQRQVDADFRRTSGGATARRADTSRSTKPSHTKRESSSPMQSTVSLLQTGDAVDWISQINFNAIEQRALMSLMTNPPKFHSHEFNAQKSIIQQELTHIDSVAIVDELLAGIDRPSLTFVGGSRSKKGGLEVKVIEANRPDVEPCVVLIQPGSVGGQTKWLIEDITVPSKSLSLLQLFQYRLIENLPQMPTYAPWVHPGRLHQSEQVTLLFNADPADPVSFNKMWNSLAEDTKTWPIAKARLAAFEQVRIATREVERP